MDTRLVDASLTPELAPRRFKFTSRQGRDRRTRLLVAARELLREYAPEQVTFADVCKRAQIPRPSAYHFFPNVEAIFLGIRLLHAETLVQTMNAMGHEPCPSWQDYVGRMIATGVEVTQDEPAFTRLIYGHSAVNAAMHQLSQDLDARMAGMLREGLEERFILPQWDTADDVFAVAFAVVDSLLKLSYRRWGKITPWMIEEAKSAATGYLRKYLPETCPARAP